MIVFRVLTTWFRRSQIRLAELRKRKEEAQMNSSNPDKIVIEEPPLGKGVLKNTPLFEQDYTLSYVSDQFLFDEYLEMGNFYF